MAKNALQKLHLGLFVYGDKYLDICISIVLPNLLALIADIPLDVRSATRLRILTDPPGRARLTAAPIMKRLRAVVEVDMSDLMAKTGFDRYGGYGPMILGQAKLVHEASLENAGMLFCPPDLIWSKGSFAEIVRLAQEGYRAVIGPSARGIQEELIPIFEKRIADNEDGTLEVSSTELTALTFEHWQQMNDGFIWNGPPSNSWKSYAYWRVGDRQYLMKCWQGPALFLWPHREVKDYDGWIDHRLIKACAHTQAEIYVVPDAKMIQTLDLAPRDRGEGHKLVANKGWYLFKQLLNRKRHSRFNILYGCQSIRIYDVPVPESVWRAAERRFNFETRIPMFAAIAVRPVAALADGAYRHSGVAGVAQRVRELARSIPVVRAMALLARAGEFRPRRLIDRVRGGLKIRTRALRLGVAVRREVVGLSNWIRGVLQLRTRWIRFSAFVRRQAWAFRNGIMNLNYRVRGTLQLRARARRWTALLVNTIRTPSRRS